VLEHEYGLPPDEALVVAIAQRDRVTCLFLRLCAELTNSATPQLKQYLNSLGSFIRGAQDWGVTSLRYITPEDPADLPSTFTDTPTDDSLDPLEIPAISWWWDLVTETRSSAEESMNFLRKPFQGAPVNSLPGWSATRTA
jgi:hypothetical protein